MTGAVGARAGELVESVRTGLTKATLSMFEHAPYPLEHTLSYEGDPGLLGPGSISWLVLADPAAIVGGLRGLLIQAAHPEVVAGVDQHSRYRDDPFGRLSRTSAYVTATTFGAMPEVEQMVAQVRRIHRVVKGTSSRGIPYDAAEPGHAAWVHNVLTESFLAANQAYARRRLTADEADRFVDEQTRIGALLDADPMPDTAPVLSHWVHDHPDLAPSPEMTEVIDFLTGPPLSPGIRVGYEVMLQAALAIIPESTRAILGVSPRPGAKVIGAGGVRTLRWALGYSPSWALALERCGEDVPWEMFKQIDRARVRRAT